MAEVMGVAPTSVTTCNCIETVDCILLVVSEVKAPRQRRAQRAEATRRRIAQEASRLFASRGYQATTVEAVADAADVSVETIYKRYGTKRALLRAALDLSIVDIPGPASFLEQFLNLPALRGVRAESDQVAQVRMLAAFSRATLQRSAPIHQIIADAGAGDDLAEFITTSHTRRRAMQRAMVDLLAANGPLRIGPLDAAETYSALANPDLYALLTQHHGWTPEQYERWLAETVTHLLLLETNHRGQDPTRAPAAGRETPEAAAAVGDQN